MNSIARPYHNLVFSPDGTNPGGQNNEPEAKVENVRTISEIISKSVKTPSDKFDLKQIFGDEASDELKALGFNEQQTKILLESLTQEVNLKDLNTDRIYLEYCMEYLQNLPEIFRKVESGDLKQGFLLKFFESGADITCAPFAEADPTEYFEERSKLSLYVLAKFITHLNSSSPPLEQRNKYQNYLEAVLGQGLTNLQETENWINIGGVLQKLNPGGSNPALNYLHTIVDPKSELKNQLLEKAKGFYDSHSPESDFNLKNYVHDVQSKFVESMEKQNSKLIKYSDIINLASSKSRVLVVHDIHHDQYYFSNSTDMVNRNFRPELSFYTKTFNKLIEDFIKQGFTQIQIHPSAICASGADWWEGDTIKTINEFLKSGESSRFTSHLLKFKQSVNEIPRSLAEFASLVEDLKEISNETGARIEILGWSGKTEQQNKNSKTLSILGSHDIISGDQSDAVLIDFSTYRGAGHSLSLGQPNLREICSEAMHCFFDLRNDNINPNTLYALSFGEDFQQFLNEVALSPNKAPDVLISVTRPE